MPASAGGIESVGFYAPLAGTKYCVPRACFAEISLPAKETLLQRIWQVQSDFNAMRCVHVSGAEDR